MRSKKIGFGAFSCFIDKIFCHAGLFILIFFKQRNVLREDEIKSYKQVSNTIAILIVNFTMMDLVSVIVLRRVLKRHQSV